ncbi:MAG: hypothetical protein HC944_06185 [Nanoarchaeota archaeon]|nr:hypothetical protein [Nanoarchaeota archaeon]
MEEWLSPRYLAIRKKYDTIQELYTAQKLLPLAGRVLEWDASFSVRSKFMRKPDYRRVVVLKKLRQLARMMEKLEPGEREGQARIAELYAAEGWDFPE